MVDLTETAKNFINLPEPPVEEYYPPAVRAMFNWAQKLNAVYRGNLVVTRANFAYGYAVIITWVTDPKREINMMFREDSVDWRVDVYDKQDDGAEISIDHTYIKLRRAKPDIIPTRAGVEITSLINEYLFK